MTEIEHHGTVAMTGSPSPQDRVVDRGVPERPDLERRLAEAKIHLAEMSPAAQQAMRQAQRESWVRGEMQLDRSDAPSPPPPISRGITPEHIDELRRSALMIRRWIPETFPEDENGQIHFARAVIESVASTIERALGIPDGGADTEAGEHQEVLVAIQSHNSGEEE
ncbi:hypothetical protein LJR098_002291 [Rhizobium sp. LjRoot98]|uniref:hypothetical protein n=1 Tax=Rhizobium sp. LjRoot98 TaxID=3342345 RepID=UPI003ECD7D19